MDLIVLDFVGLVIYIFDLPKIKALAFDWYAKDSFDVELEGDSWIAKPNIWEVGSQVAGVNGGNIDGATVLRHIKEFLV